MACKYWAIMLDKESRDRLIAQTSSVMRGWQPIAEHCTLAFRSPVNQDTADYIQTHLGQMVEMNVVALGMSDEAIAVQVDGDFATDNRIPHITLAVPPGGKPVNSNNIQNWIDFTIDAPLYGVVSEIVNGRPVSRVESIVNELTSRKPVVEAADGVGDGYETLKELALWLLNSSNVLNVFHWNSSNNTKHELLNEAYELCRSTADKLGETYVEKTGKKVGGEYTMKTVSELNPSDKDVVSYLTNIQTDMNNAVEKNEKFSEGIKNVFADFDESITSILYKYKQFDS